MCDHAHPRALPAVPGDGSHPSWALPARVHEGLGYPASHCLTAYKVMPWPGHEQQLKTPASSTCAETVLRHGGDLLTPHPPYKGEGRAGARLTAEKPPHPNPLPPTGGEGVKRAWGKIGEMGAQACLRRDASHPSGRRERDR